MDKYVEMFEEFERMIDNVLDHRKVDNLIKPILLEKIDYITKLYNIPKHQINDGYCSLLVYEICLELRKIDLSDFDIKIINWENLHTFIVVNNIAFDAEHISGISLFDSFRRKCFFAMYVIDFREKHSLLCSDGTRFDIDPSPDCIVLERVLSINQFIDEFNSCQRGSNNGKSKL